MYLLQSSPPPTPESLSRPLKPLSWPWPRCVLENTPSFPPSMHTHASCNAFSPQSRSCTHTHAFTSLLSPRAKTVFVTSSSPPLHCPVPPQAPEALELALMKMCGGEHALITATDPTLVAAPEGAVVGGGVPPGAAAVVYDVTLTSLVRTKERWQMNNQDKVRRPGGRGLLLLSLLPGIVCSAVAVAGLDHCTLLSCSCCVGGVGQGVDGQPCQYSYVCIKTVSVTL